MAVVAIVPLAHEASDGRVVIEAPARTNRVEVKVSGTRVPVRLVARRDVEGRVRIAVQVSVVARTGADLELVARDRAHVIGRAAVPDVHLLGVGAFTPPRARAPTVSGRASAEARRIAAAAPGRVGISAECVGTGLRAEASSELAAVAASTLKVAILASALADDERSPTRGEVYATYRAAIVESSNDAANRVLATLGNGSHVAGGRRVNGLMAHVGMRDSTLGDIASAVAHRSSARPPAILRGWRRPYT